MKNAFPLIASILALGSAAHADLKIVQKNIADGVPAIPGAPTAPTKTAASAPMVTTT
ncbi:MAG: hypothetical protein ACKO5K_03910 [Armatimonadota bacterium]